MQKNIVSALVLVISMFVAVSASALQVEVFTNKALWLQAYGNQCQVETFDDDQLNQGISYTSSESGNVSSGVYHDVLQSDSQNSPMTTWTFQPQISGYGGDWTLGGPGGSGTSLLVYLVDFSYYVGAISNDYNGGFWGFIADTPFTSVRLIGGSGSHQQHYTLDNMVYCTVPLPGTIWLLGGGLALLLGRWQLIGPAAFRRFKK